MAHDDLLDLKAERDDWQNNAPSDRSSKKKGNKAPASSGGNNTGLIIITLALALLLGAMGYWVAGQFNQVYGQFDRVTQQFELLSQRVKTLEGKLDLSNDTMSSSDAAVRATLKEHGSEIRKLWGVSYDTNRKAIKANKTALTSLKSTANQLQKESKILASQIKEAEAQLTALSKQLGSMDFKGSIAKLRESQNSLKEIQSKSEQKLASLSEKMKPISSTLESHRADSVAQSKKIKELNDELLRSITDIQIQLNDESLKKRVDKLSGLIDSIDKNRSRVNAELVKLSNRVNELQKAETK